MYNHSKTFLIPKTVRQSNEVPTDAMSKVKQTGPKPFGITGIFSKVDGKTTEKIGLPNS